MATALDFEIIHEDKNYILIRSQSRPKTVSHVLNFDGGMWHCSCEQAYEGSAEMCKHRLWANFRTIRKYAKEHNL